MVTKPVALQTTEPFAAARAYASSEFQRLVQDQPEFSVTRQFSVEAYNGISAIILERNLALIDAIDRLGPDIDFFGNLALHLHRELQKHTCYHYFLAYEKLFGFVDPQIETGPRNRTRAFPAQKWRRAISKTCAKLQPYFRRYEGAAGWIGNATFPWDHLVTAMGDRALNLKPISLGNPLTFPRLAAQQELLADWSEDLHRRMIDLFSVASEKIPRYSAPHYGKDIDDLLARPAPLLDGYKLIVTGTLGRDSRTAALNALTIGLPVITMHHGSHYMIFDEPYYPFYEAMLTKSICGYGDIERQKVLGTIPSLHNLNGDSVRFHSRTDPEVRRLHRSRGSSMISAIGSLRNKTVVYLGTDFSDWRYGPNRDVHPATYLAWQQVLLNWSEQQSGCKPLLRLHPHRRTSRYDPKGYNILERSMEDALHMADVFVVDYPTTSLAYLAATDKPILFIDLGLRRLHPKALEVVRQRCHYARIDVLEPEEGLNDLAEDLDRECEDTFTPLFCLSPEGIDEVTSVAQAAQSML